MHCAFPGTDPELRQFIGFPKRKKELFPSRSGDFTSGLGDVPVEFKYGTWSPGFELVI